METIAVIGAGISGMSIAHLLSGRYKVKVFEKEDRPGGLIKCDRIHGHLYHKIGGHVFNSRREDVLDWFWSFFDRDKEFIEINRNAVIALKDGKLLGYPIENNLFHLERQLVKSIICDLLYSDQGKDTSFDNFEEFLQNRFGNTLYELYFRPYNEKIWQTDLKDIPLSWLEGKLPMPKKEDIFLDNIFPKTENQMVHSSFFYPKQNGSQFIADRLAKNIEISFNSTITEIRKDINKWLVNNEPFDKVIFCGNIKDLPAMSSNFSEHRTFIEKLDYHGTTTVLCEITSNPYSWIYLPDTRYQAHRIICTGNFSRSNNANGNISGTVEFSNYVSFEDIISQLSRMPFSPKYIAHQYAKYTYPVQNVSTRRTLEKIKKLSKKDEFYLLGRFAEWEYYNMDTAMAAAIDLSKEIK